MSFPITIRGAVVGVLQALLLLSLGAAGWLIYRQLPAGNSGQRDDRGSTVLQISNSAFEICKIEPDNFDFQLTKQGENDFLYRETLGFKNKLYIIGGGHCALALSELMSKLDFHISLFDDSAELYTLAKNEFVH